MIAFITRLIWGSKSELITAIEAGKTDRALELIEAGQDLETPDPEGQTPLHYAASYRDERVCEALIKARVNINALDIDGMTPIDCICFLIKQVTELLSCLSPQAQIWVTVGLASVNLDHFPIKRHSSIK
ncbi:MAG: ankyrin repeat domain-containing protein [Candidatus Berkiellales bacterium]